MQEREQATNKSPEIAGIPLLEQAAQALEEKGAYKDTLDSNALSAAMTVVAKSLIAGYNDVEATPLMTAEIENNKAAIVGSIVVIKPVDAIIDLNIALGNNRIADGKIQLLEEPKVNVYPRNLMARGILMADNTTGKIKEKLQDPQELFGQFLDDELEKRGVGLEEIKMNFKDDLLYIDLKGESIYADEVSTNQPVMRDITFEEEHREEIARLQANLDRVQIQEPAVSKPELYLYKDTVAGETLVPVESYIVHVSSFLPEDPQLRYMARYSIEAFSEEYQRRYPEVVDLCHFSNELGTEFLSMADEVEGSGLEMVAAECFHVAFDHEDPYMLERMVYANNFINAVDKFIASGVDSERDIRWIVSKLPELKVAAKATAFLSNYAIYEASYEEGKGTFWKNPADLDRVNEAKNYTPVAVEIVNRFSQTKDL